MTAPTANERHRKLDETAMTVVKSNGEREPFDSDKLRRSLRRAGASRAQIDEVVTALRRELYSGISTRKLYKRAFKLLKRRTRSTAARYSLSRAIRSLGPHGYGFEKLVAAVLEQDGYRTELDVRLPGVHVLHEIDVIATATTAPRAPTLFIECKHRLRAGAKCDVKVALYVSARATDLRAAIDRGVSGARAFDQFWLVTSGDFTLDAIAYAGGVELRLLGWRYPEGSSLRDRIERAGLHPLTCLTTLDRKHKLALIERRVVLCRELLATPEHLAAVGVRHVDRVLAEIRQVVAPVSREDK